MIGQAPYKFGNHNKEEFLGRGKSTYGSKVDNSVCECPVCFGGKRIGLLACKNCKGTGTVENSTYACKECGYKFSEEEMKKIDGEECPECGGPITRKNSDGTEVLKETEESEKKPSPSKKKVGPYAEKG